VLAREPRRRLAAPPEVSFGNCSVLFVVEFARFSHRSDDGTFLVSHKTDVGARFTLLEEEHDMIAISTTSLRRILWSGLGYALVYLASVWNPSDPVGALFLAAVSAALALQLLRVAVAGLRSTARPSVHPVQSGERSWRNRGRFALQSSA
jgi:hypothetical protein